MRKIKSALFIFRRDLRVQDNTGLAYAVSQAESVIPCFIFDPHQVDKENSYRSTNAIQFMTEALRDLDTQLREHGGKLYLFYGDPATIIAKLIKACDIDLLVVNADYTPFSIKRDKELEILCEKNDITFYAAHDALLNPPGTVMTGSGTPYSVFTAFYKASVKQFPVAQPVKIKGSNFFTKPIPFAENSDIYTKISPEKNPSLAVHGGRKEGLALLRTIKKFANYLDTRDIPSLPTTHMSAHLKFGTISVRETYYTIKDKLGAAHPLIKQLYWRDFFTHVAYHSPFVFGQPYHKKYVNLWWSKSEKAFTAWCTGTTGFPIVDAGMRELNTTGFMHNRVRMIVASFLTKDLHIDWRWGEQYFAQQLVDYDPAVNNGNWQWSASTGCDAQPYFRIFNPWLQQKKFDPECMYIKKWVPELKQVLPLVIHNWYKENSPTIKNYPRPIVDHSVESKKAKELYRKV